MAVWLLPFLCAIYAVWIGRDANWDVLNYHYYNAYALLNGRLHQDLAVGQLQTLFNPLLDVPLYLGMEHLPPRVYAALLGGVQGLNLIVIFSIAKTAWPSPRVLTRVGPLLVTLVAGCGAAFLTQLGTCFGDSLLSLPLLVALRILLSDAGDASRSRTLMLAAGVAAGIACGLRPIAGIYALALAAAAASLPGSFGLRTGRLAYLALGGLAGTLLSGGWWFWIVWKATGNPLFPYYNDLFHSPLYWNERFVFSYFLPKTLTEALLYPWIWLANSTRVSEMRFFNLAIPGLITLAAFFGAMWSLGFTPQGESQKSGAVRALAVFWACAYALWLTQSAVYRFAVVLELLAPLLIASLLARWVPTRLLATRTIAVLLPVMVLTYPANFGRYAYGDRYMSVAAVPLPPKTLVAVAGWAPLSYMVPAFPPATPIVRIQSNMHGFPDRPNGLDTEARRRLETHDGPIHLLLAADEWSLAQPLLDRYGYHVDRANCQIVDGTLAGGGGAGRLHLCPLAVH